MYGGAVDILMSYTNSPNMQLPIPTVGNQPGPDYALNVNSALSLIDSHDHTPGYGVQITPAAMNINTALTMNDNFLIDVAGVTLLAQSTTPVNQTLYMSGVDLYYTDGIGNNVRITQSGAVAGTPGSIANLVAPASASYVALNSTFVFQSNTNTAANLDAGSLVLRNVTPNSTFALTLQPPASLSSNYSITLPGAYPLSTAFMTLDAAGNMGNGPAISGGIGTSNIANQAITSAKIANNTITATNIANGAIGSTQIAASGVLANNIAADSITTSKIVDGNVTRAKLEAVGQQISASSGAFITNTNATVTNLTVTITTSGRPVYLMVQGTNQFTSASGDISVTGSGGDASINIFRGASLVSGVRMKFPNSTLGSISCLDVPAAGTYTYTVKVQINSSPASVNVQYCQLVAYEL